MSSKDQLVIPVPNPAPVQTRPLSKLFNELVELNSAQIEAVTDAEPLKNLCMPDQLNQLNDFLWIRDQSRNGQHPQGFAKIYAELNLMAIRAMIGTKHPKEVFVTNLRNVQELHSLTPKKFPVLYRTRFENTEVAVEHDFEPAVLEFNPGEKISRVIIEGRETAIEISTGRLLYHNLPFDITFVESVFVAAESIVKTLNTTMPQAPNYWAGLSLLKHLQKIIVEQLANGSVDNNSLEALKMDGNILLYQVLNLSTKLPGRFDIEMGAIENAAHFYLYDKNCLDGFMGAMCGGWAGAGRQSYWRRNIIIFGGRRYQSKETKSAELTEINWENMLQGDDGSYLIGRATSLMGAGGGPAFIDITDGKIALRAELKDKYNRSRTYIDESLTKKAIHQLWNCLRESALHTVREWVAVATADAAAIQKLMDKIDVSAANIEKLSIACD